MGESGPLCISGLIRAWKPCSLKRERAGQGASLPFPVFAYICPSGSPLLCHSYILAF